MLTITIQVLRLTSTSDGTIFIIPLTKSCDALRSEDILWASCPCISISFPLLSSVTIAAVGSSLYPELDGKLGGASRPLISSNFSSNWLNQYQEKLREWKDEASEQNSLSQIVYHPYFQIRIMVIPCLQIENRCCNQKATIPDKVNIYRAHWASKNYSVSPLRIINSLHAKDKIS